MRSAAELESAILAEVARIEEPATIADAHGHKANGGESFPGADDWQPPVSADDYGLPAEDAEALAHDDSRLPPLTIDEWLARDLPPPDFIMGNWLTTTTRALLYAPTGLGKSLFAKALAMHAAAGSDFLHWRGRRPCKVLYVDGEMSRRLLRQRIADEVDRIGERPAGFFALSHEDIDGFAPLNTDAGQRCIESIVARIGGVDLIIFDAIMCLLAGDPKENESWSHVMTWVRSLTKRNIGQVWIHHTGHDASKGYGDKSREWQLCTVIALAPIEDTETDVSFALSFKKARERTPAARADFTDVRIKLLGDQWHTSAAGAPKGELSPLGRKFYDALVNVIASDSAVNRPGRKAAKIEDWRAECVRLGLLDRDKTHSARTMFSKHRRELIAANHVVCDNDFAWLAR